LRGEIGPQGLQGPKGDKGDKGDRGDVGPQGPAGKDGVVPDIEPIIKKTQDDFNRWRENINKSLASLGGGGLGERDVIAIAQQYGGGGGSGTVDSAYLSALQQSLVPLVDSTYDLGTTEKRWKDLHLSGTTIYLGDGNISINRGKIQLQYPDGTIPQLTVSNTTTIPGTTDLDMSKSLADSTIVETVLGGTDFGPFGEELRSIYDCLEPAAQSLTLDLGAL
jgi:hypothetical protein